MAEGANKGVKSIFRTPAEKIEIANKICEMFREGFYTIASCCKAYSIPETTFRDWAQPNLNIATLTQDKLERVMKEGFVPEVHVLYKAAKLTNTNNFKEATVSAGRERLLQRINGFSYTEVHTEVETDAQGVTKPVSIKKIEKHIPPDTTAIIFALKALDPDNFREVTNLEISTAKGDKHFEDMSMEELDEVERRLQEQLLLSPQNTSTDETE